MAVLGTSTAIIDLDIGGLMGKASQAQGALDRLGASSGKGLDSFSKKIGSVSGQMQTVGQGAIGFGAIIGAGFGFGIKSAVGFEAQMSAVGSVTGATGKDLDGLRTEALRLGKDTSFSASESAQAMEIMAKAGVSVGDISNGATEDILNLANAAGVEVPMAAKVAATAMNVFGVSSKDAADIISRSANVSSLDVNDWALALKSAGPVAAALGIPMDDVAAGMIILGDAGIKGEVGATALRNIMLNLADTSSDGTVALAGYGVAAFDANNQFRGMEAVTHDLAGTWATLTQAQKLDLAQTIAGNDGVAAFTTIMDAQTASVKQGSDAFEDSKTRMSGVGDAATQAAQRMDNFKGAFEQFKGSLETVGIVIGSKLLPALRSIVDVGTSALNFFLTLPSGIQTAIAAVTGIVGILALAGGAFLLILPRIIAFRDALTALKTVGLFSGGMAEGGMFAGLGAALPVILAVAAALGVLYLAYKTNFLGFGDGVRAVGSGIKSVFNDVTGGIKMFGDVLTGTSPKVDNLNKTQRAWVDGMRAGGATQEQINGYLRAQGVSSEYTQKKYDLLNKSQRAWVDGLRAGGATQEQIDGYLRAQGVSAEYTTSQYESLRKSGLDPLEAEGTVLITRFSALNSVWKAAAPAIAPLYNGIKDLLSGDFSGALDNFKQSWSGLKDIISGIDFGAIAGGAVDVAIDVAVSIGNAIGAAYTSAKAWLVEKYPWLGPVIDGIEEYVGKVGAKISAAVEAVAGAAATAFTTAKDFLVDQYPWLAPVLGGTAEENGRVRVQIDILEGTALGEAIQSAFGTVSDAEHFVVSKIPWLGSVLYGTGSVSGDLKVMLRILENPAQGIGNVFGAVSDAEHYVVSKIPWLGAVLYGTGSVQGDIKVALAILEGAAQGLGNVFGAIGDAEHYVVSKIPWLGTVLYGTGSVQGDIKVAIGILEGLPQGIGNVFGAIGDAEHYVVSKIPWLGTVLYGTGSVQGDIRVAVGIIEGAAQGIGNVFGAVGDAEHYVISKIPWLGTVLYGTGSVQGDIRVALGIIEGAAQGIGNIFGAVGDAEHYVVSKIPWLSTVLYGSGSVQGDINVAIGILEQGAQGIGNVFGAIGDMEAYVISKIPWLGTVLKGTGSVSGDISVAINIVEGAGSGIADFLTGKTGTITVGFPDWTWPAYLTFTWPAYLTFTWPSLPTFSWPALPSWKWPSIPAPDWLPSFIGFGKINTTGLSAQGADHGGGAGGHYEQLTKPIPNELRGGSSVTINAIDNASDVIASIKAAIEAVPASKITAFAQAGGEAVAAVSSAASAAIKAIPASKISSLLQSGGEGVASAAAAAGTAITGIPTTKSTLLSQFGGEGMAAVSSAASLAINAIPASKTSLITQFGGENVAATSAVAGAAINAIPAAKISTLLQSGGEGVIAAAAAAGIAISGIPPSAFTSIEQAGAESVALSSNIAQFAITAIPGSHFTDIAQAGAEGVAGSSNVAMGAVQAIPTSWFTSITEAGGAGVAGSAGAATSAISAIPTSHGTSISEAGSGGVIGAANGVASAVNAIPSSKTVTISIVRSGVVTFAKGGVVPADTTVARLAERGPELFRNPSGSYGMAMEDALYPMTPGARVFTAAQTRKMLRAWDGPAFAGGGYIPRAASSRVSASSSVSLSGGLLATVDGIVAGVQSTLQSGMQAATSTIQTSTTAWPTIVGAQQGSMTSAGTLVVGGLQPTVQLGMQAATTAIDTAATAWPTIVGAQQNPMADAGTMVGTSMSEGTAAGISGAGWSVSSAAVSVVDDAIAAANAAAGIASPSTEMIPVGEYMDAGLAQGIYNGQSAVVDAAVSVAQAAVQAAQDTFAGGGSGGGGLAGVYNDAATMFGREMGSLGGAIINGWEMLTDGFWKSASSGVIQKGILAEDGGYVNPGFYDNGFRGYRYAAGGTVRSDTARMGELGPELLRYPSGTAGMALTDGLYTVPLGTYVYTAAQTKRMMRTWKGPAYANGGRVTRPATPIQRAGGSSSNGGNVTYNTNVNAQIHTTGKMDDGEKRELVQDIATSFRDGIQLAHMGRGV